MSRHFPLLILLTVVSPFITLHMVLLPRWDKPITPEVTPPEQPVLEEDVPDFASIRSVRDRKSQFFDFIAQYVDQRNLEILELRKQVQQRALDEEQLRAMAKKYRVKWTTPEEVRAKLLMKVDAVPSSLVLAQAALESAWGTSRFAARGNNFFGQWCHTPGCGIVPDRRLMGKNHEVQVFETPFDSVAAYMRNLNSHPAYKGFREKRAELRAQRQALSGCYVARGLTRYSEMGNTYVESVKLLIRSNQLEQDPRGYCTPVEIAQEPPAEATMEQPSEQQTPTAPKTLASDQAQQDSTPAPAPESPPAG